MKYEGKNLIGIIVKEFIAFCSIQPIKFFLIKYGQLCTI